MPNPFSPKSEAQEQPGVLDITDSQLFCERCGEETDSGKYYEAKTLVVFVCPNGHRNEVVTEL